MTDISPYDSSHSHASAQAGLTQTHLVAPAECAISHGAGEPTRAVPKPEEWACKEVPPRTKWWFLATYSAQKIFVVVLKADGLSDLELPVHTITIRMRDVRASYLNCMIPDPVAYTDAILERADGQMHLYGGELTMDGVRHLEELIYGNVDNIYFGVGSGNMLTLTGLRYITHENPAPVEIEAPIKIKRDRGRTSVRSALDFFTKPTDIVTVDGESFTADLITRVMTPRDAYMDIEGI